MNIYIIAEGEKSTKKIYSAWVTFVNGKLCPVELLADIKENNFFVYAGHGQSEFPDQVSKAIEDVKQRQI